MGKGRKGEGKGSEKRERGRDGEGALEPPSKKSGYGPEMEFRKSTKSVKAKGIS